MEFLSERGGESERTVIREMLEIIEKAIRSFDSMEKDKTKKENTEKGLQT